MSGISESNRFVALFSNSKINSVDTVSYVNQTDLREVNALYLTVESSSTITGYRFYAFSSPNTVPSYIFEINLKKNWKELFSSETDVISFTDVLKLGFKIEGNRVDLTFKTDSVAKVKTFADKLFPCIEIKDSKAFEKFVNEHLAPMTIKED